MIHDSYPDSEHIDSIGLSIPAKDKEIWEYERKHNFVIVTNDEDFYEFAVLYGFPPFIVLLRMGNQSTRFIADTIRKLQNKIIQLTSSKEFGLLEIY